MGTMSQQERVARENVEAIYEKGISNTYNKLLQQHNEKLKKMDRVPTNFNFYITIFYNGTLIRSRTLNAQKDQDTIKKIEEKHVLFFENNNSDTLLNPQYAVGRTTKKASSKYYTLLKVGYLSIIVSDDNKFAIELCSVIIATMYTHAKAQAVVKERGQLCDLVKFCKAENEAVMSNYLAQVVGIQAGTLGGYI